MMIWTADAEPTRREDEQRGQSEHETASSEVLHPILRFRWWATILRPLGHGGQGGRAGLVETRGPPSDGETQRASEVVQELGAETWRGE